MAFVSNRRHALALLVFVIFGFLIYSNTFDASFHFDDSHVISNLSFEEVLERCKGSSRVICHLTFALNYWLGGTHVLGYHIFNTLIHIGTAYFVYIFLLLVLSVSNPKSPLSKIYASNEHTDRTFPPISDPIFWPAFFGGALFLVHPLATQAVTYITQRYSSLAGFFYIGSLTFFVSARIKFKEDERFLKRSHLVPYLCSFLIAVLAMRTKEMAITLPAGVLLTEYYFVQSNFGATKKRILYLLPLLCTGLIIPVSDMIGVETISIESVAALKDYTWGIGITRQEYLFTQFKIILGIYLKLFLWPIGQNIDHDFVVSKTLFDLPTMASFLALCLILATGLWFFRRSRLVSFGVLWFFVTISPTSSIVPNVEFVAEHRAYISVMGLAFAAAGIPSWESHWKRYLCLFLPVLFSLSGITYSRNTVWRTDLSLWKDAVAKSPKKYRPHHNLGLAYSLDEQLDQALEEYQQALRIKPAAPTTHTNIGNVHEKMGQDDLAMAEYKKALRMDPCDYKAHTGLGKIYHNKGFIDAAVLEYKRALRINPRFLDARKALGNVYLDKGLIDLAITEYKKLLQIDPDNARAYYNLGISYDVKGLLKEAISHYKKALEINADYPEALSNLGIIYGKMGYIGQAIEEFNKSLIMKPDDPITLANLAFAYERLANEKAQSAKRRELTAKAIETYEKVVMLDPDNFRARERIKKLRAERK